MFNSLNKENIDIVFINPSVKYHFNDGFRVFREYSENKIAIISHGRILKNCIKSLQELSDNFFLVDLFRSKPISKNFVSLLEKVKKIIVIDEQTQYGNLTTAVQSELSKYDFFPKVKNISLPDEYVFQNGGRDLLLEKYNLDENNILNTCKKFL